ncbi:uncharacterized protein AB675_10518 [Cyphellophora attinorum]|uniref:5-oxoprolinase n=1 Tax=Cyphellophora attinorum TaxID=1664694 RepID=A0A0N1HMI1_9EURO|nr:uncharacterized protein AB675_10518 [Phialophora attinorum]KPI35974.1 hypothetical protein AB675_10518 [Phialophora attinorum]
MSTTPKINISIDRGGTFTDIHASVPGKPDIILKLLSVDPANYQDAPTEGFRDLLKIGNQSRPKIFDLSAAKIGVLYENVIELDERIIPCPAASQDCLYPECRLVEGTTGEKFRVLRELDIQEVSRRLTQLWEDGYRSVAVALLHSYAYPEHELEVGKLAVSMGFSVALSSSLQPMIKVVPRGMSASADAYLTPVIKTYIDSIDSNFDGVVGFAATSWDQDDQVPVIGFDMGGTSTDVCRFDGTFEHVFGASIAGVSIQSPQLNINTVAAGGGSILSWRNGLFMVGPESASAHPGPACYRKGGPLTVTDANLFLGRLLPEYFPKIFGPKEDMPLDKDITVQMFSELTTTINKEQSANNRPLLTADEVALGFLNVADESMARPIRNLTEARGFETSAITLLLSEGLGVNMPYSSVLSAYGLALADVVKEAQEPVSIQYRSSQQDVSARIDTLIAKSTHDLTLQGFDEDHIRHEIYLNMRYEGSDTSLMILKPAQTWDFATAFKDRHRREFGFTFEKPLLVDDVRVRSIASSEGQRTKSPAAQLRSAGAPAAAQLSTTITEVCFKDVGRLRTPVYLLKEVPSNTRICGPAIIIDETQTIVVTPGAIANVLDSCLVIDLVDAEQPKEVTVDGTGTSAVTIDPVRLSIFGHRFMSIAEQMGNTLQKTSVSTNIKERLDFSCALFSPDGGLVANAPHVPVHLGSMQFAVRYQHQHWLGRLKDGDLWRHTFARHYRCYTGFPPSSPEIVFYVASRGHHADIGGVLPGSMPPKSTELWQEGAAIRAEKIVEGGKFNETRMIELLLHEPSSNSCQYARHSAHPRLITEYGLSCVQAYMFAIQDTAETAVRNLLRELHARFGGQPLESVDYMDDGSPIQLRIQIDEASGSATFDFTGTGSEVYGNTNAPVAITHSAIIYCLRCMIQSDIPLNQGCLAPIDIKIPERSLLSPSRNAAVVGGNVLTSQRITDVILKAFGVCAASQGCTNNLTFGTGGKTEASSGEHMTNGNETTAKHVDGFGYYETIAGGAGAGPIWDGESGVHTHMTNTCITDPEILEKRYPCVLRQFSLREGSGGAGARPGGDGVVREIEFLEPVQCSILSERRVHKPHGMWGGGMGKEGLNLWLTKDEETGQERRVNLGGKNTVKMNRGDRIVVMTPGGGAWGEEQQRDGNGINGKSERKHAIDIVSKLS